MFKRREFLIGCSALAAQALVPAPLLAAASRRAGGPGTLTRERFLPLVNTRFRFYDGMGPVQTAWLVAVENGPQRPGLDQFFLVFRSDSTAELRPGIREAAHGTVGAFQVYLEPAGRDATGCFFEAPFSLLV